MCVGGRKSDSVERYARISKRHCMHFDKNSSPCRWAIVSFAFAGGAMVKRIGVNYM